MKVNEALPILEAACGKPLGQLFAGYNTDLRTNKGDVGQRLLRVIGLELDSGILDFEDGELKTNKSLPDGTPDETMWIHQIASEIDSLVGSPPTPFASSQVYKKISNLVYLPVVKTSKNVSDWYFIKVVHVQCLPGSNLFARLEDDYNLICQKLRQDIEIRGGIHTSNGRYYLQIRSKDSKRKSGLYNPIYSNLFGRQVANKNHGFYFMKPFMIDAYKGKFRLS